MEWNQCLRQRTTQFGETMESSRPWEDLHCSVTTGCNCWLKKPLWEDWQQFQEAKIWSSFCQGKIYIVTFVPYSSFMKRSNLSCTSGERNTSIATARNTEAAGTQTAGMTCWVTITLFPIRLVMNYSVNWTVTTMLNVLSDYQELWLGGGSCLSSLSSIW